MANEKNIDNEIMNNDELNQVAGGNRIQTYADGEELCKRGLISEEDALHSAPVRNMLHKLGYTGYEDNGGLKSNVYTDKNGNRISRMRFWANFDKENGTSIIR